MTRSKAVRMRAKLKTLAQTQVRVGSHTLEVTIYKVDGLTVIQKEWSPTKPSAAELRNMNSALHKSLLEATWKAGGAV